jgi:succinate-semialdehyde dehydrogenase/glutarate-semialdehyde dehydrogenase
MPHPSNPSYPGDADNLTIDEIQAKRGAQRMATMIIEGDRAKAASGKTYQVRNPATGEVVDEVPAGGAADVDKAAQAAAKAFTSWSKLPANQRREILHKASQHMLGKVEEIAQLLTKEQGKTLLESRLEAKRFGENIGWFADLADKVHGQHVRLPDTTTYGLVVRRPIGVCGAIVPWNFPLTLAANKVAPAIAAGNTVVLKPASTTPLSTLACIEALMEGGLPEGVINVVLGQATGEAIVEHPLIRKIALTGSTPTGKRVMAKAAEQLKKITLELGGSDPCIVLDDADLEGAVRAISVGRFFNCGQQCLSTKRLYVQEGVYDALMEKLVAGRGGGADQGRSRSRRKSALRRWPPEGRGIRKGLVHRADNPRERPRRREDVDRRGFWSGAARAQDQGSRRRAPARQRHAIRSRLLDLDQQHGLGLPSGPGNRGGLHLGQRSGDRT